MRFSEVSWNPEWQDSKSDAPRNGERESEAQRRWEELRAQEAAKELERKEQEAAAFARRQREEKAASERLAEVERGYGAKADEQALRSAELTRDVRDRCGEGRPESMRQLRSAEAELTELRRERGAAAVAASGRFLLSDDSARAFEDVIEQQRAMLREQIAELECEQLVERGHLERMSSGVESHDAAEVDALAEVRSIATKVVRTVAVVIANHFAPGFGGVLVNAGENIMKVFGVVGDPNDIDGVRVGFSVTALGGLLSIDVGTTLYDDGASHSEAPVTFGLGPNLGTYDIPSVDLVEESPRSPARPDQYEETEIKEVELEQTETAKPRAANRGETAARASRSAEPSPEIPLQGPEVSADEPQISYLLDRPADAAATQPGVSTEAGTERRLAAERESDAGRSAAGMAPADAGEWCGENLGPPGTAASDRTWAQPIATSLSAQSRADAGAQTDPPIIQVAEQPLTATGVVMCGSMRKLAAAAGTRYVDAALLVSAARHAVLLKLVDDGLGSIPATMRALKGLEIVVFLDPEFGGGIWIDVDPVTQTPAATMLVQITVVPGQLPQVRLTLS